MDGINPTLAFLALIFGLSGNARDDAANDPASSIDMERGAGCPVMMFTGDPPQPTSGHDWHALWDSAGSAAILPEVMEPQWTDPATPELPAVDYEADPIVRHAVPSSKMLTAETKPDPCPEQ